MAQCKLTVDGAFLSTSYDFMFGLIWKQNVALPFTQVSTSVPTHFLALQIMTFCYYLQQCFSNFRQLRRG
jgi:hypothetical protein